MFNNKPFILSVNQPNKQPVAISRLVEYAYFHTPTVANSNDQCDGMASNISHCHWMMGPLDVLASTLWVAWLAPSRARLCQIPAQTVEFIWI